MGRVEMTLKLGRRNHLAFVLRAIEAKQHPKTADLLAVIQAGDTPKPVLEYIAMLNERRGFIGAPSATSTDKKLDRLQAQGLVYREIEKERKNSITISVPEAIKRVARKEIDGLGKRKLEEYCKGMSTARK
jgi:hypothetical protein